MSNTQTPQPLGILPACLLAAGAIVAFSLSYAFAEGGFLMVVFLACVYWLAWLPTRRQAYYFGWVIGLLIYTPHLLFFFKIFGYASVALWYVLPFWLGLFVMLGRACLYRFGPVAWACLAPFVWTGFEFFRSELYYLRFSWLNPGFAFSNSGALHFMAAYGVYGIGFLLMAMVSAFHLFPHLRIRGKIAVVAAFAVIAMLPSLALKTPDSTSKTLRVAGVQLEFPSWPELKQALDQLIAKHPDADVLVLSEYTFLDAVPKTLKDWCRQNRKYVVVGGEDPALPSNYYNTAFVVDTNGAVVFQQAKCVPVQFMKDGLPARRQQLWDSPWGKIGIGICYDDCYSRVTDELIRQGAQALIVPTLDGSDWGLRQHLMHGRVALMRAAEYGVPILRVCGCGISEFVDGTGHVRSSAPFPGEKAMLAAEIELPAHGRIPPDRWLARISVAVVVGLGIWLAVESMLSRKKLFSS